jgi:hypothetical protein
MTRLCFDTDDPISRALRGGAPLDRDEEPLTALPGAQKKIAHCAG